MPGLTQAYRIWKIDQIDGNWPPLEQDWPAMPQMYEAGPSSTQDD